MLRVIFLSVFVFVCSTMVSAQIDSLLPTIDYQKPQDYEIGGIKVVGNEFSDATSLISISGLRIGDKIKVPGAAISRAINNLWNYKLFTDIQINKERTQGNLVFLEIAVQELPRYVKHAYSGVKKGKHDDLNKVVDRFITKGSIFRENDRSNIMSTIRQEYVDKGYLDAKCNITTKKDEKATNSVNLMIDIKKGKKVKISNITFDGNEKISDRKLRKKMKKTSRRARILKKSKFVKELYKADKENIEEYYNSIGYRDAKIVSDSVWRDENGRVRIHMNVAEGKQYFFRDIKWKGNTIYEDKYLSQVLGINKGAVYNQELLENRLKFSQDGRDISSLYLDNGYLFFTVDPVEVAVTNDSIDLEIRMYEGAQATIDKVTITGNDRTSEHVIRRELYTRPGDKFSRSDIIRSQREIINLGYFNPEKLGINTPVNPQRGTVDIEYTVEEKPSDQLELSAGYQPATAFSNGGVIGTLGVTFNNFSLRNIKDRSTWNPLPQGDGQRFSIRGQTSGSQYQSYNVSFTEPWLGGKRPNSLTVAGVYNRFTSGFLGASNFQSLNIIQGSVGFGTRLKWPDDNFIFRADADIQTLNLDNWLSFTDDKGRAVKDGTYNNWSLGLTLARNTINDPTFPRSGSLVSLKVNATPPYSLFRGKRNTEDLSVQELYRYIEYLKYRLDAEWYTPIVGKLTLKTSAKIGILGRWSASEEVSPFERYSLGGDGLNNQGSFINGRSIVSMRGYESTDIAGNGVGGATVFNKYTVELRYPISTNPQSTIYVMTFAQAGNAWATTARWNPFDLRRSAGVGLRVFLPMFGTLGFDYGFGFDKPDLINQGAALSKFGNFNIVLGFEPD